MELHPQLQQDTHRIGQLNLCHCLLMDDARYPWVILVPAVEEAREVYQLSQPQRSLLMEESCVIQQILMEQQRQLVLQMMAEQQLMQQQLIAAGPIPGVLPPAIGLKRATVWIRDKAAEATVHKPEEVRLKRPWSAKEAP